MVHFNITPQILVNLKCVTYAQPVKCESVWKVKGVV